MTGDRTTARLRLVPAAAPDPAGRLLAGLPPGWHGEVIGPGIEDRESIAESGRDRALRLEGLPARLRLEIAWMARWQHQDGLKVSVDACNQLASLLAWASEDGRMPPSLAWAGKQDLLRLHGAWFHSRHARLPAAAGGRRARPSACPATRGWLWRPVSTTGPGGSWTPGIRGATRASPCACASPAGRSGARPGKPGCRG
jgi:hypothetical protein